MAPAEELRVRFGSFRCSFLVPLPISVRRFDLGLVLSGAIEVSQAADGGFLRAGPIDVPLADVRPSVFAGAAGFANGKLLPPRSSLQVHRVST